MDEEDPEETESHEIVERIELRFRVKEEVFVECRPETPDSAAVPTIPYKVVATIDEQGLGPGLRIRANILGFSDRRPTRDQKFLGCPTEFRPDPKPPENPKLARKPESGRVRVIFRARKSEFSESFRIIFFEILMQSLSFSRTSLLQLMKKQYF